MARMKSRIPGPEFWLVWQPCGKAFVYCNAYAVAMFRSHPRSILRSTDRSQVIFLGGIISALLGMVLLLLAYMP